MQPRCTPQQKAEALRLLAEVGKAEAARRTGIPAGTIASWGVRNGVTSPPVEAIAKANEVAQLAWEERRLRLKDKLGAAAEQFIDQATKRISTRDVRDLTVSMAVCIDKAQLLAGAATARTEASVTNRDDALNAARERADRHLRSA